jgi:hypothetical protein
MVPFYSVEEMALSSLCGWHIPLERREDLEAEM